MSRHTAVTGLNDAWRDYNNAVNEAPADTSPDITAASKQLDAALNHPDLPADHRQ